MVIKLFYLTLFSFLLGNFGVVFRLGDGKICVFDILTTVFAVIGCYVFVLRRKHFVIPKNFFYLLIFLFWVLLLIPITTINLSGTQIISSIFYLFRFGIYVFAGLVMFNLIKSNEISLNTFLTVLFLNAALFSILGFIQLLVLPDFSTLDSELGLDPHKNRLTSTFLDPNFAGGFLGLILAIALSNLYNKSYKWTGLCIFMFIVVPSVALFLTFSRSSWGMLATFIFLIGIIRSRWLLFIGLLLAFFTYFAVPRVQTRIAGTTDPADSAAFRIISWQNASKIALDNLYFGVGFNSYRYAQKDYGFIEAGESGGNSGAGTDSGLLLVLATSGVFGFLIFAWTFLSSIASSFVRAAVFRSSSALYTLVPLSGLLLHSQFVNSLFYPPIMFLWPLVLSSEDLLE